MTVDEAHFRKLEAMYAAAPCNRGAGPVLEITGAGRAAVTLDVSRDLFHAAQAVHGSWYFRLLDDAAFFAANSLVDDVFVLTASFNVQLLRPISAGKMRAEGEVVRAGKNMSFSEAVLYDGYGEQLARGSGVFARSRVELGGIDSYVKGSG